MKNNMMVLVVALLSGVHLCAQSVFPTYRDRPVWCMQQSGLGQPVSNYLLELEPDTLLCGRTYQPVKVNNQRQANGSTFSGRIGYVRTEQSRVYFRSGACDTQEALLYDFAMTVGDTFFRNERENITGIVSAIDTIYNDHGPRRRMTVFYVVPQFPAPPRTELRIWIEGLGDTQHPFLTNDCLFGLCEAQTEVVCFSPQGQVQFGNCSGACGILSAVQDRSPAQAALTVFPNPVRRGSPLELKHLAASGESGHLWVVNAWGQVLYQQNFRQWRHRSALHCTGRLRRRVSTGWYGKAPPARVR